MAYTKYSLTPSNNTATPPDGAPEGMLPSAVNDTMRDMMAQIRDCGDGIRDGTYTMTAPKITGGTITGAAFTGNTFTNPVISGGSINNTPIGATTANTGAFTTLSATGVTTVQAGTNSAPAITTAGDTNTGIFFPAADTIAFTEGGTESMRIDSAGNVGIGTSSPSSKLSVFGSGTTAITVTNQTAGTSSSPQLTQLNLNGFGNEARARIEAIDQASSTNGSNLRFYVANTSNSLAETMRIDSSGNVGIGTSSPAARIDAQQSTTDFVGVSILNTNNNVSTITSAQLRIGITNSAGASYAVIKAQEGAVDDYPALTFGVQNAVTTNPTERMRITSAGNVGIGDGTITPASQLQVYKSLATAEISLQSAGGSGKRYIFQSNTDGSLGFYDNNASAERMRIDSSGNVGIGVSSPTVRLDIAGSGNTTSRARFEKTGTGKILQLGADRDTTSVPYIGSESNHDFSFITNNTERMRINSGGVLLVGSTSSVSGDNNNKAQVTGSPTSGGVGVLSAYNSASSGGDASPCLTLYKKMTTTSSSARFVQFYANDSAQPMGGIVGNGAENVQFLTLSDEREKTNIQPVSGSLNRIMQIQVSSFNRKGSNEFVPAGFIAQNVLPVYPEYVVENAANDGAEQRYGITGGMSAGYIAELTAALQELKKIVDAQAAEIALLKSK